MIFTGNDGPPFAVLVITPLTAAIMRIFFIGKLYNFEEIIVVDFSCLRLTDIKLRNTESIKYK